MPVKTELVILEESLHYEVGSLVGLLLKRLFHVVLSDKDMGTRVSLFVNLN